MNRCIARSPHSIGITPDASLLAWARSPDGIALFLFSFGMMFLHGYNQQRLLGIMLIASVILFHTWQIVRNSRVISPVPPLVKAYTLWAIWACVTGPFVIENMGMFSSSLRVVAQMVVLIWAVFIVQRLRAGAINAVLLGIICGGLVQVVSVLAGAESFTQSLTADERVLGQTANPNTLGIRMSSIVMALLMFWHAPFRVQRWWLRCFIIVMIPLCGYVVLVSGSRKSLVAFVFLLGGWGLFAASPRKNLAGTAYRLLIFSVLLVAALTIYPFVMQNTIVGKRFEKFFQAGDTIQEASQENIRYWMYVEGLKIFARHPIAGVGLSNFGSHFWKNSYSHSDYIEPLATTGLIGFVLYHSIYFFLLWRTYHLMRSERNDFTRYRLRVILIGTLTVMVIGLGAPHYASQHVFVLLTAFSTYVSTVALRKRATVERTRSYSPSHFAHVAR